MFLTRDEKWLGTQLLLEYLDNFYYQISTMVYPGGMEGGSALLLGMVRSNSTGPL